MTACSELAPAASFTAPDLITRWTLPKPAPIASANQQSLPRLMRLTSQGNTDRHARLAVAPRYRRDMPGEYVLLHVRITPEQHAKLERLAKDRERSSAWMIRKLIDRAEEPKP